MENLKMAEKQIRPDGDLQNACSYPGNTIKIKNSPKDGKVNDPTEYCIIDRNAP